MSNELWVYSGGQHGSSKQHGRGRLHGRGEQHGSDTPSMAAQHLDVAEALQPFTSQTKNVVMCIHQYFWEPDVALSETDLDAKTATAIGIIMHSIRCI